MSRMISLNKLLHFILKLSFRALNFCEGGNKKFEDWNQAKNLFNYRLNRIVFRHLGRRCFCGGEGTESDKIMGSQFVLDAITEVVSRHFELRGKIYHFTKIQGFSHERLFVIVSLISIYCLQFIEIINCFRNLGVRFKLCGLTRSDSVCLAINFPSHGFSIPGRVSENSEELAKPFSSFGEFLLHYVSINGNRSVLSLGEYVRRSKRMEKQRLAPNENHEKTAETFPRMIVKKSRSISAFWVDFNELLSLICRRKFSSYWKDEMVLQIKQLNKFVESIKYKALISHLTSTGRNVESIFIIPFENPFGYLKYDPKISKKTFTYNYGDNLIIPPSRHIHAIKNLNKPFDLKVVLSEISLSAFRLSGKAVGFTDIFYFMDTARKAINDKYDCALPCENEGKTKQRSAVLGFEVEHLELEISGRKNIAIFDVPPEGRDTQLSRALSGDRTCDFKFIEEFLLDIVDLAFKKNCRLLFKPKYSLLSYSLQYRSLIESIKDKLSDRFILISPYLRIESIIEVVDICLCFPYTSPKSIAEEFGKQAYYYVPERYRSEFETSFAYSNSLIGRVELDRNLFHMK
jgi:hypothetical protein